MSDTPEVKIAETSTDIHPYLKERFSPRAFADREVGREKLHKLFEAAHWAPSSSNAQPWRFMLGVGKDNTWQQIFDCLDEGNQDWCRHAPVLVMAIAKKTFGSGDKRNRHYMHDVGQALSHLTFQAMHENIYVHQMAGFYPEKAKDVFGFPDDFEASTCVAIGYLGDPDMLSEKNRKSETQPRERKPLSDLVFNDGWGKAFRF